MKHEPRDQFHSPKPLPSVPFPGPPMGSLFGLKYDTLAAVIFMATLFFSLALGVFLLRPS